MLVAASSGLAQCATQWVAGSGLPATGALVNDTLLWDPDGAGPLPQVLVVGGGWIASSTATPDHIATVDLTTGVLTNLGSWTFGDVTAVAVLGNGELVAAGWGNSGSPPGYVTTIARWSLGTWLPVGVTDGQVSAMVVASNGDLLVGGVFSTVNGTPCASIARWNGTSWSSVGAGVSGTTPYIDEMVFLPNGDLVVAGSFTVAGSVAVPGLARWDGSSWAAIGSGYAGYWTLAMAVAPNGDLLCAGRYTPVSRWDGVAWTTLGNPAMFGLGFAEAIAVLPDGDVVVGAAYTQDPVMRWDGVAWAPVVAATSAYPRSLTQLPNGDLFVGMLGGLTAPGLGPEIGIVRLTTTCPATTTSYSPSCASSGGSNQLTASLPWTGGTWTSHATGLPNPAFVLAVTGFAPAAVPLANLLPQGVANCSLRVQPDHVLLTASSGTSAAVAWAIPDVPALAGTTFYHQLVSLEYGLPLQLIAATGTNALRLVIGTF